MDKAGMLYMSLESKIRSLKAHPLIQVLADNGGNPRTLVLIEPLWGVCSHTRFAGQKNNLYNGKG